MILSREQIDARQYLLDTGQPFTTQDKADLIDTARAYHDAADLVAELVSQHCYQEGDGSYDTAALSTNRDAFELLVQAGRAEYVGEQYGRRAFIRFKEGT